MLKHMIGVAVVLAAAGAVLAYQEVSRGRQYRSLMVRGDEALNGDQTSAAIEAYSGAIALRPDSTLAYLRRGEAYRRRLADADLGLAARDFREAVQLDPSSPRPLEELGDVLYQLQRYDRAIDAYERSGHLDDRSARVSYKLALAHYRNGDASRALAAAGQAVRLDSGMTDAQYLRGLCLRDQGQRKEAVQALEKAVSLSPALVPAREELADLYRDLGRPADALQQLEVLASLDRDHVERHVAVSVAQAQAHHWDAAILALRIALERMPDDPVLHRTLGQVWLASARARDDREDLRKAREALEQPASSPGATSDVLTLWGETALDGGDVEEAVHALQEAATRFPVTPRALKLYATVSERLNHLDLARRALVEYGALVGEDADFVGLAIQIATLSLRLNDRVTAVQWISRGLKLDAQNDELLSLRTRAQQ
jgi:tetratricopeptide (TPR) repeat protein